ncbi:DNA-directed RNA polymerase subunit RPC12/RpoP [Arthrobacter sp. B3I9]|uniref:hypothetical protein n=1 Tax=Arthrobacter sp. B3I9 TaxID=3042270 RepID=UPI002794F4A5|nr:hypothetical protein [Arthrobacter sp. B3I9]MDQ0850972.1 DNA-directed RNA polymerase subunit RPC12/RpoP [Arthrobacter sp. B3I9]
MTIDPNGHTPDSRLPQASPLQCTDCRSDSHLSISSIESLGPASENLVTVSYTCTACGQFLSHTADVAQVAVILNKYQGRNTDVLVFGGHYIHCGRPMEKAGSGLQRIHLPVKTDQPTDGALAVYLSTRVLRCPCGFQIELPE